MTKDRTDTGAPGGDRAHAEAGAARDPDLERLLQEMRALMFLMPMGPVPPEADEEMFDNMPV
ncbi:MAG: hypothetical protein ACK4GO_10015 [Gemmobacter sp.]